MTGPEGPAQPAAERRLAGREWIVHGPQKSNAFDIDEPNQPNSADLMDGGGDKTLLSGLADPRLRQLPNRQDDWTLQPQIDSDDDAGWMWGDVGTLFYAVRRSLEPRRRYEEAWMVFQCG